jgi:hypothetical protein
LPIRQNNKTDRGQASQNKKQNCKSCHFIPVFSGWPVILAPPILVTPLIWTTPLIWIIAYRPDSAQYLMLSGVDAMINTTIG